MNKEDHVRLKGTEHTAKVVSIAAGEAVIIWDEGGYGRMPIERLEQA